MQNKFQIEWKKVMAILVKKWPKIEKNLPKYPNFDEICKKMTPDSLKYYFQEYSCQI